ncbi:MAG: DUF559 domain-containing protein, partial [Gemmatimonadota bacterium]
MMSAAYATAFQPRRRRARCWIWPQSSKSARSNRSSPRHFRAGLATEAGIVRLLTRYPRRAGSPRLMALLRDDAPPAFTRSEAEGRFLQLVRRAGLPAPAVNTLVCGFEVDFCWIMHKLVVEIDGLAYHSTRAAQRRDRRRDATLTASGWRVLRFSWDDVTQ